MQELEGKGIWWEIQQGQEFGRRWKLLVRLIRKICSSLNGQHNHCTAGGRGLTRVMGDGRLLGGSYI